MTSMPFTHLTASLKQMAVEDCPEFLRALFQVLFPRFYDSHTWSWDEHAEAKRLFQSIPKVVLVPTKSPRRFGGYALPRGRYFTVCSDIDGHDHGTLIHELRAYRDPVRTGMVEVLDFGMGESALVIGDRAIPFARQPQFGVIIHEPQPLEQLLSRVPHERFESPEGKVVVLVRFSYRIDQVDLPKTLDLRDPATRDWFGAQFAAPNGDWIWPDRIKKEFDIPEAVVPPQTIISMYERSDGQAPVPGSFAEMLPTLLNPVRGGGDTPWGGATLMAIGECLRNCGVDALIYPASRSDAFALYDNGELRDFGGWCLVDYRRDDSETAARYVVLDQSPWSWVALPSGVSVAVGRENSINAGSLRIDGLVERSRIEYLHQLASLHAAKDAVGPAPTAITPREAFAAGTFMLRWLHLVFASADQEAITAAYRIACGLTLRNDHEYLAGKIRWVYQRLVNSGEARPALESLVEVGSEFEACLPEGATVRAVYTAAFDLELALLILTRAALSGDSTVPSGLTARGVGKLNLPAELKIQADVFLQALATPESAVHTCASAAVKLARGLAAHYSGQSGE